MAMLGGIVLKNGKVIPGSLLDFQASRSGGPGGQHVNKVATKVDLRLDLNGARDILGDRDVDRIRRRLSGRIDREGRLRVTVSGHRTQAANLRDARERLGRLIDQALARPRARVRTRVPRTVQRRRVARKRRHGQLKRQRSARFADDE